MNKQNDFNDPLEDIDPIMEQAFSVSNAEDDFNLSGNSRRNAPRQSEYEGGFQPARKEHQRSRIARSEAAPVSEIAFPRLRSSVGTPIASNMFNNIPINVSVELGRAKISLKEVFELTEGAIVELERFVGEPLDLVVNGQTIAHGEVVAVDNHYGFRVTSIIASVSER